CTRSTSPTPTATRSIRRCGRASPSCGPRWRRGSGACARFLLRGEGRPRSAARSGPRVLAADRHRRQGVGLFVAWLSGVAADLEQFDAGVGGQLLLDLADELEVDLGLPAADEDAEAPAAVGVEEDVGVLVLR